MMICLQILLTILFAEEIAVTNGISRIMAAAESQERRELFIDFDFVDVVDDVVDEFGNTLIDAFEAVDPSVNFGMAYGYLDSSVSVQGHCSGRQGSDYVCSGTGRYIKWNVDFGNSDFVVESEFKASSVAATALTFVLWSNSIMYHVGLDGAGNTHFYQGGQWGGAHLLGSTNLDPSRYQKIKLRRTGNSLLVTFDGHEWTALPLSASITAVGWRPWRNTINIKSLIHY